MGTSAKAPRPTSAVALDKSLRAGLPARELARLKEALDIPNEVLARIIGISKATLSRRPASKRLSLVEGDRVLRYSRLFALASEVMESEDFAREWLKSPQFGLGGRVPLDFALTEIGAREVEMLLGRIEHGVYS